jgi:membrane protease YdiL (CAAX protease family)
MESKSTFRLSHLHVYLLSAPFLLSIYYYHNSKEQFQSFFQDLASSINADVYAQYWKFCLFFILVAVIPFLYILFFVKKPFSEFGLGLGNWKLGLKLVAILVPLVIAPLIWIAAHMPDIRNEYPMARSLFKDNSLFWQYELVYILCYYIAWEFFFRGFLLFGLAKDLGVTNAILIQTISSCLIHLGKPEGETLGSIATGIIFGIIAIRTQSIWYVWILHFSIGVLTDYFVLRQMGI